MNYLDDYDLYSTKGDGHVEDSSYFAFGILGGGGVYMVSFDLTEAPQDTEGGNGYGFGGGANFGGGSGGGFTFTDLYRELGKDEWSIAEFLAKFKKR